MNITILKYFYGIHVDANGGSRFPLFYIVIMLPSNEILYIMQPFNYSIISFIRQQFSLKCFSLITI